MLSEKCTHLSHNVMFVFEERERENLRYFDNISG